LPLEQPARTSPAQGGAAPLVAAPGAASGRKGYARRGTDNLCRSGPEI